MGATNILVVRFGKTASDAYKEAVDEANDYYGHKDGYSGAINSSHGFTKVEVPGIIPVGKWLSFVEGYEQNGKNTHIPKKIRDQHLETIRRHWRIYEDKYTPMLCVEMRGKELKDFKASNPQLKGKRGSVFMFCGFVPE